MLYRTLFKNKKLVVFDLDGTIANTEPYMLEAVNTVLSNLGGDSIPNFFHGEDLTGVWKTILEVQRLDSKIGVKELVSQTYTTYLELIAKNPPQLNEGFLSLCIFIKDELKLPIALCTNTPKEVALQVLKYCNVTKVFDFMVFGDEVRNKKPDPEIYNKILKTAKVNNISTLVFEDSIAGSQSSVKAGIDTVVIWSGELDKRKYSDKVRVFAANFDEIIKYMDFDYEKELNDRLKRISQRIGK